MSVDFGFILSNPAYQSLIITGVRLTLIIFVCSWFFGMTLGIVLTAVRGLDFWASNVVIRCFVEYHRNVPNLIQLFVWYFGIASLLPKEINSYINARGAEVIFAVLAFGCNKAAYLSEDLRSGLRSISITQMEAARSTGLTYVGAMRWVILPQTWRLAFPSLANQTLFLFKMSSLAAAIGAAEMTYQVRKLQNVTFRVFETYSIATVIYLIGSFTIMWTGVVVARRVKLRRK